MHRFEGKAKVFTSMEDACEAVSGGQITPGTVIVIRYEGPKGGPGMREMHMVTSLIVGRGMDEMCALVTDGRFSGSTRGPAIGHVSPEAAAGGPIAIVQDGDPILIDIPNRRLDLLIPQEEIDRRLTQWKPLRKPRTPALDRYSCLLYTSGTLRLSSSKSFSERSMPASWAMAGRCRVLLVEAPMAMLTVMALRRASRVMRCV